MAGRLIRAALLLASVSLSMRAEMVRGDSIGNDPAKEKLCAGRANDAGLGKVKIVPFEIDSDYVSRSRSARYGGNPGVTFIAVESGMTSQLVECDVNPGTGRYGPISTMPEQPIWRLVKPEQFKPGIRTSEGIELAGNRCRKVATDKIARPNFDHSVTSNVAEVNIGSVRYHIGVVIGDKTAERYDIVAAGVALYRTTGPDLDAVKFTCLFSPLLEVRAIQLGDDSHFKRSTSRTSNGQP